MERLRIDFGLPKPDSFREFRAENDALTVSIPFVTIAAPI